MRLLLSCGTDWLTDVFFSAGLEGNAEAREPLNEDVMGAAAGVEKTAVPALGKSVSDALASANEDLGLLTKLAIFGAIVGCCVLYVKLHSPRRTGYAGRHGAYEKSGLP